MSWSVSSGAFGWYDETKANAENLLTPFVHNASTYALGTPMASALDLKATSESTDMPAMLPWFHHGVTTADPERCCANPQLKNLGCTAKDAARWQILGCAAREGAAKSATPEEHAMLATQCGGKSWAVLQNPVAKSATPDERPYACNAVRWSIPGCT